MVSKEFTGIEIAQILGYTEKTDSFQALNEMMYLSPRDERFVGRPISEVIQIIETANALALSIIQNRGNKG